MAEVFVTERNGLNVAYTQLTSGFVQRDERWWQEGRHLQQWNGQNDTIEREIGVIISTQNEEPLEDVKVTFNYGAAPQVRYTNSNGYVSISIPKGESVKISLKKEGFEFLSQVLDLTANLKETPTIRLKRLVEAESEGDFASSHNAHQPSMQSAPEGGTPAKPEPIQFITEHYALLNSREYDTAWSRLSNNFKYNCPIIGKQDYIDWWNSLEGISVLRTEILDEQDDKAIVQVSLNFQKDGRLTNEDKILQLVAREESPYWHVDAIGTACISW